LAYELGALNIAVKLIVPHGGVTSTHFSERSDQELAKDASLADYDDCAARTRAAFARMTAARMISSDDVAKVIYAAATDGTSRLRYLVGMTAAASSRPGRSCPIKITLISCDRGFPTPFRKRIARKPDTGARRMGAAQRSLAHENSARNCVTAGAGC
jgi:hypothetical protein